MEQPDSTALAAVCGAGCQARRMLHLGYLQILLFQILVICLSAVTCPCGVEPAPDWQTRVALLMLSPRVIFNFYANATASRVNATFIVHSFTV